MEAKAAQYRLCRGMLLTHEAEEQLPDMDKVIWRQHAAIVEVCASLV